MRDWQIVTLVVPLLALMWIVIGYVTPILGPWGRLVAQYPANQWTPTVSRAYFVSMSCRWFSYGNCLTIDFGEETMTVRMGMLCLPFHAPFTVPKSAVRHVRRRRFLFVHWTTFTVDDCQFLLWGPHTRTRFFDGMES